jgi:kinesin family protein 2/24
VTKGLSEHPVGSPQELHALVEVAKSRRATAATEKNDESSRSHGVAVLRVGQPGSLGAAPDLAAPADGVLYVIDLAGSERAADSKGHTKERMDETKQINLSLMALKECIRARTLASTPGHAAKVHVPYRRSKLTMLLKDVFEHTNARLCATVVIAAVSPLARDAAHSGNTLQYAAPLRVAAREPMRLERDERDPALWRAPHQPPPPPPTSVGVHALRCSGVRRWRQPSPRRRRGRAPGAGAMGRSRSGRPRRAAGRWTRRRWSGG